MRKAKDAEVATAQARRVTIAVVILERSHRDTRALGP
jgi:hypothetical protein